MGNRETRNFKFETQQLHVGQEMPDPTTDSMAVPIYQTTAYVFPTPESAASRFALTEAGNIYTRIGNPTTSVLEARMAALEGGVGALALASGSAATTYVFLALCSAGDHVISAQTVYGGTYNLLEHTLPKYGITTTFVAPTIEAFAEAITENTKALFVETLGNPNSNIVDIDALADLAHSHKIPLVVDNTFATPFLFRPIEHGADIVIHSATKFIGGHGTTIGGVIVDGGTFDWEESGKFPRLTTPDASYHGAVWTQAAGPAALIINIRCTLLRDTGACISPLNAWLLLQGLETLSLRVERHVANTKKVIKHLAAHPAVAQVNHPSQPSSGQRDLYDRYFADGPANGAGSIFTIEIEGGYEKALAFCKALELFSFVANVADSKSLVIHPASTTHSQMSVDELLASGIKPNTVRLSIGTEHIDDIIFDLDNALGSIA